VSKPRHHPPIERLLAQPQRFQFFQALRLVERWHGQHAGTPRREVLARHVHFRNSLALHFPPSEIESLRALPLAERSDAPLGAEKANDALPALEMVPAFFGLLGANGALPLFYTELFAQREAYHKDRAARAFLDVFQQRAVSLLYEAWRKHRLPLQYEEARRKHFLPAVLALAGLGHGPVRDAEAAKLPDESIAYFAGAFQQRTRSAVQMQRVLQEHFGVPIAIEQFVGRWHALPDEAQTSLGLGGGVLGESALVGARVWQRDLRLRLVIGPLPREKFAHFLPHGRSADALRELLTLMTGLTLEYEVQLLLAADAAPPLMLGGTDGAARLGWDSWLLTQPPQAPLNDARYDIHATA
jgi:type VI secretion system protein ImpH